MAFDAALAIRVGSASLFVLLGVAIMVVGRRRRSNLALGSFLAAYGLLIVLNNLSRVYEWDLFALRGAYNLVFAAAAVWAACSLPAPVTTRPLASGVIGTLASVPLVAMALQADPSGFAGLTGFDRAPDELQGMLRFTLFALVVGGLSFPIAATAATLWPARPSHQAFVKAAALTAAVGIWWIVQAPTVALRPTSPWALASTAGIAIASAVLWAVAAVRTRDKFAARMILAAPALAALVYLYFLAPGSDRSNLFDPWYLIGIARLAGWSIVVYAVLQLDLLGVPLPHIVVRRGAVAGSALAVLFIVAQVAQNFFSAEYGLLTGGIMAGGFVFAASPIQRAFERMGSRESPAPAGVRTRNAPAKAGKQQEEAYRGAVRLAWKDRRFDQSEELALAVLADSMGLSAARATAIRHEVEREKGVR